MVNTLIPLHGMVGVAGPGRGLLGLLVTLLLIGLVVKLVRDGRVGPVRWAGRSPQPRTAEDDALATLGLRLANGEITPEEYLERSSVLHPSRPDPDPGR